jgi:hypothetical protein
MGNIRGIILFKKECYVAGINNIGVFHVNKFVPAFYQYAFVQIRDGFERSECGFDVHIIGQNF